MTTQEISRFVEFCKLQLRPIEKESGRILYSSIETLRPGSVYILGHNPGGSPVNQSAETIKSSVTSLSTKKINYYLDEAWFTDKKSYSKGLAPLQQRIVWLLQQLGLNPRDVAASNLIFARSADAASIKFNRYANLCWPVHERIIDIIKPKILIVFGNSLDTPYTFLRDIYGAQAESSYSSGHGDWMCRSFNVKNRFSVIGLPHLSRYKIISHCDVVDWINSHAKL
jgi:hypothetical protein